MESCYIDDSNGINETYRTNSTLDLDTQVITLAPPNNTIFEGQALNLTCNAIDSESIKYTGQLLLAAYCRWIALTEMTQETISALLQALLTVLKHWQHSPLQI